MYTSFPFAKACQNCEHNLCFVYSYQLNIQGVKMEEPDLRNNLVKNRV